MPMERVRRLSLSIALTAMVMCMCVPLCRAEAGREDAQTYYTLGKAYYEQGRYKEAEELFQKSLDILAREQGKKKPEADMKPAEVADGREQAARQEEGASTTAVRAGQQIPEYVIGDDDELRITVWQNADLDQDCVVRPDGRISFPLVGDIVAKGLTLSQLKQEIAQRLKEFVRQPQVSIAIKKMGGSKIVILGEVAKPGIYNVSGAKTVFEAIAMAGGQTQHAVLASVVIIRDVLRKPQAKRVNLVRMMNGRNLGPDLMLRPEDVVFVPKKFIADLGYFLGQVVQPIAQGAYVHHELKDW